jgi:hypothetical protein
MTRSETAKLWADRLRRFEQAEMTVAEFCAAEDVSQPSFYKWKKKLVASQAGGVLTKARFLPVAFESKPASSGTPTALAKTTVELPGGVRIHVEVPTDSQASQSSQIQP